MSQPDAVAGWEPRRPAIIATLVFLVAMLVLCWPMLTGKFLYGSDQQLTGYAFRHFGAEYFKAHGSVPLWNPYIFGGMPSFGSLSFIPYVYPVNYVLGILVRYLFFPEYTWLLFHTFLTGVGTFLLLRGRGVAVAAAVAAGARRRARWPRSTSRRWST